MSTSYTDLATTGPSAAVAVPASGTVLVVVTALLEDDTASDTAWMSFVSTGGTGNVSASDARALAREHGSGAGTGGIQASAMFEVGGLSGGAHTFTAKYRVDGGTGTFVNRSIVVIPLP